MTHDEFLARFPLKETHPFVGRGPHRAHESGVANASGDVLVHLLDTASSHDAQLIDQLAECEGIRIFVVDGASAVVTPNSPAYHSLEAWLAARAGAKPANPDAHAAADQKNTQAFTIRFRPKVSPAADPHAAPPRPATPTAAPMVAPPAPPVSKQKPGMFTEMFGAPLPTPGQSRDARPTSPPPSDKATMVPQPPASPSAPIPQATSGRSASPGKFTELFGGAIPKPVSRDPAVPPAGVPLATPQFFREPTPEPPRPAPPPVAPPAPMHSDPNDFDRFFGAPGAAIPPLREAAPPPPPPPAPPAFRPPPASPSAAGGSPFTQVISSLPAPSAPKASAPASAGAAPTADTKASGEPNPGAKSSVMPMVVVLSLAAVAVLVLILVFVLLK